MVVFRYNSASAQFEEQATLLGFVELEDIKTFEVEGAFYLATASQDASVTTRVYKLSGTGTWQPHQTIPQPFTSYDLAPFTMQGETYLVALMYAQTSALGRTTTNRIYKWDAAQDQFRSWRTFPGLGSADAEVFQIDGATYMTLADFGDNTSPPQKLYQVTPFGLNVVQTWTNVGQYDDMEYFQWKGQHFLMHGVFAFNTNTASNSVLYKATPCL